MSHLNSSAGLGFKDQGFGTHMCQCSAHTCVSVRHTRVSVRHTRVSVFTYWLQVSHLNSSAGVKHTCVSDRHIHALNVFMCLCMYVCIQNVCIQNVCIQHVCIQYLFIQYITICTNPPEEMRRRSIKRADTHPHTPDEITGRSIKRAELPKP